MFMRSMKQINNSNDTMCGTVLQVHDAPFNGKKRWTREETART